MSVIRKVLIARMAEEAQHISTSAHINNANTLQGASCTPHTGPNTLHSAHQRVFAPRE